MIGRNVKPHCWQDSGSSESYRYRVKNAVDPREREILNVADQHSHSVVDPHVRGDNVIHCVADPHVIEM